MHLRYILSTLLTAWANIVLAQGSAVATRMDSAMTTKMEYKINHPLSSSPAEYTKQAEKLFNKASEYYRKKDYENACNTMQEAINNSPRYVNAYSLLGEWYFKLRKYEEAANVFRTASTQCRHGERDFAKPLARSLLFAQRPGEALQIINGHTTTNDPSGEWKQMQQQGQFMITELGKPLTATALNMGVRVNTEYPEVYPFVTADTQTLHFTRRVKGMDEDFFYAKADSCGGWFTAQNMGMPPNTFDHEYAQTFSVDGHYLFFTKCENRSENGWDKGGCDLFMSFRKDSSEQWSVPQGFGATINSPGYEGMACLSADNRELYFVSDRAGGFGGKDIWVSRFEEGLWQAPRNAGPGINTKWDELSPYLHMDNRTLYFASKGHAGMGGSDLFFSRRINDTTWGKAINMGFPMNSTGDELSISITENGKRAYFASDRDKMPGDYDLYEIDVPEDALPIPVNKIEGYVYDSFSKERLNFAAIYIYDAASKEELYHFNSNRGDGSFMITLPAGGEYEFRADRISYIECSGKLEPVVTGTIGSYNISMLPDGYVAPITDSVLFNIHFPVNSSELTDADKKLINDLVGPWLSEGGVNLFVNGYTDSRGNPLLNEQLSFERARLVAGEISSLGFNPDMMEVKGWGEANPIADNETEEGQAQNRRVEVMLRR
jgi:outer membrane protein OmpA-like peptidoglycan-associated protein